MYASDQVALFYSVRNGYGYVSVIYKLLLEIWGLEERGGRHWAFAILSIVISKIDFAECLL